MSLGLLALVIALSLGTASAFAVAPVVEIDSPGAVSYTTANLTGTIDPQGQSTLYAFEYSTDQVNWSGFTYLGPVDETTPGPKEVATELTGLVPGTQYWVRLNAMNFIDPEVLSGEPNPTLTTTVLPAPSVSVDPVSAVTSSSAHFSGTIDPEAPAGNPAAADVSWRFECSPECPGLEGSISADSEEHVVTADPTGLKPNTEYAVTLVASNAAGPVSAGPEHFTTEASAPTAETIPAFALVGGTKALLGGNVNPENSQTDYWFEYGTDTSYGISVPVTHDADAGTGEAPNFLTQEVPGLQPSTTYHFRIVAKNPAGTVPGSDQTFTTPTVEGLGTSGGKLQLPDHRVWEQVSPEDKNGWDIYTAGAAASASGDKLTIKSLGGFGDEPTSRAALYNDYVATRGSTGWNTHGISPQGAVFLSGLGYAGFSDELDKAIITVYEPSGRSLDPEVAEHDATIHVNTYIRNNLNDTYKSFGESANVVFGGASADYSHIEVESPQELPAHAPCESTEPAEPGYATTCVFDYVNGIRHRASVSPSGAPIYGRIPSNAFGAVLPGLVSKDGVSLYFVSNGRIYRRTNDALTTQIGQSERTLPPIVPGGATSIVAGELDHGDRALLQSTEELVNGDQDGSSDLYLYDASKPAGEHLTLLTHGNVPEVATFAATHDMRRIYFFEKQQGASDQKLDVWEEKGESASVRLVSTFSPTTKMVVSPDGRYLAFLTASRVTAFDNAGQTELYRYDAEAGIVACASCDPEGHPASGGSVSLQDFSEIGEPRNGVRTFSTRGQLFFQTTVGLSPHDNNGQQDVYEYENGEPRLLSAGASTKESAFLGASERGDDVFIATTSKFVGWDFDSNVDAYDARVNGGLPEPPLGNLGCEGDSCQPVPTPPNDETPASASFSAPDTVLGPGAPPSSKPKPPTRAQKLAKAVRVCKKHKAKKRRHACEKKAMKRYGRSK